MGKNLKKKIKRSRKRTYKRRIYKRTRSRTRKRPRKGPRTRTRKKRSYKGGSKPNAYFEALAGINWETGEGKREKKPLLLPKLNTNNLGLGPCRVGATAVEPYNERYNQRAQEYAAWARCARLMKLDRELEPQPQPQPEPETEPQPQPEPEAGPEPQAQAHMAELEEQSLVELAEAQDEVSAMGGIASAPVAVEQPEQPGPMTPAQLEASLGRCFSGANIRLSASRPLSPRFDGPIEVEVPRGGVKKGDMIVQDLGKYGPHGEGLVALVVAKSNYDGKGDEQTFETYRYTIRRK